ncbi:hypothetical protein HY967_00545 [Candidatus Jorgensenbacteria bacterium]|nr:hypothetical protein [Candidatus Jorgensenbacteria bacterium]
MTSTQQNNSKGKKLDGVKYLLALNQENSRIFQDPGTALERRKYREQHPTEIAVLKCMDGRLNLPVMTNTALGIIQPWRNLGGRFDLGWPLFALTMKDWVDYAINRGRDCLVIITYHYAKGDVHRGCRGFNYDVDAARAFTAELNKQFDSVFGKKVVYTIRCGIETDLDTLILHGEGGEVLDVSSISDHSSENVVEILRKMYPQMPFAILKDLLPLIQGNIEHIAEIKDAKRPITDAEHKEWVLAVGRGFDWLHEINTTLIVGPYDPDLAGAIRTAAGILRTNLEEKRITEEKGIVLMTSAPYRDPAGPEPHLAAEKAKFLNRFSFEIIKKDVPELLPYLQRLTMRVDMNTRQAEVLEQD